MGSKSEGMQKLEQVIDMLRADVVGDWQLQQIRMFLLIGENHPEGINQTAIGETLGYSQSVVSRNCRSMALFGREKSDGSRTLVGHELITMTPDLYESRRLSCTLTKKGERLYKKLEIMLGDF